ncbi:T6SS effector amidase Tae4 family protein [Chryseobacterium takakiae]|uniref:Type VI secretion system (T6SS), amidase effector protein 4 n=1 Tax=Chryseobacterium takakiae TaxID=1302685 RepID=A0A1M5BBV4_9FLAO|nr:T6SS effector amidase Tae4 family protein [Chryseobacterium takakiae]SHF39866.1 Type VI secretion system (T6SS), amidase effector protein 4 [Chryseobacterium takakiae]
MQNPDTTWEQFQNWFITKSEGQDGEYIDNLDDIQNTIQYQPKQMPTYSQFVSVFPKLPYPGYAGYFKQMPAKDVYELVGDPLKSLYISKGGDNGIYRNACTVRWSFALNALGILIPQNSLSLRGADINGQPRYYYIRAVTAGDAMQKIFGNPTHKLEGADANNPNKVAAFLKGKTGIYVIVNNDASQANYTGHVDLIQNGHIPGGANAYGVPGGIKSIRIWEFKP